MKTIDEIDVEKILNEEEFKLLFNKASLNEEQLNSLSHYFMMYDTFVKSDVKPIDAWLATRNVFIMANNEYILKLF